MLREVKMSDIIIEESFSDDKNIFEKIEKKQFESFNMRDLRFEAEEISNENRISELISYAEIAPRLQFQLAHQPDGALKILRDLNGTGLLADEVGLGKTITAGIVIKECIARGLAKKILILTPPSLVDQWVAELKEKFNLNLKIIENETDWEKFNLVIASIDRVKAYSRENAGFKHAKAHQLQWDLLIVDEAHKLKDRSTRRWEFVDKLKKKRFLILTATPFQNDLLELYNLFHLLKRGHLGTLNEFKKGFFHRGNKRHPLNPRELKRKLDEIMVRRKRSDTTVEYKRRIPQIISIHQTLEEKEVYEKTTDFLKTKYFSAGGAELNGRLIIYALLPKVTSSSKSAMESLVKIANDNKYHEETRKIAAAIYESYKNLKKDSKIEALIELVKEIFKEEPNTQILIYTKHPTTLKYIVEKLAPLNLKIVEYAGGLSREEKTARVQEFKSGANIMISTETGAEGLNFQFCHNLINYDLPWNPMAVEQRIGRLDRIGQKHDIKVYSFATAGTMEERVVDLIINKMCCIGMVIGELPIILFNLGLDSEGNAGLNKIEEMLMDAFIESKNNLEIFSKGVDEIYKTIQKGIDDYNKVKEYNCKVLDTENEKRKQ
jgi:SNF2 family DNA or RNA helicase